MGFDMTWRKNPDNEGSYFRLNIFGMSKYMGLMFELGMVFEDDDHPEWPEAEAYGVTQKMAEVINEPKVYPTEYAAITPDMMAAFLAYEAANERILTWHGMADTPGIPLHKFSSNDGWIVLPVECESAARIWHASDAQAKANVRKTLGDGDEFDYWKQWIAYLESAAQNDGFEVW